MGKVFISYSHDSPEHSERVLALSNRLRARGVDAELDRYHERPPQGWPLWCDEQLRPETSSFVLIICTPSYRARVENRVGANEGRGVYWEGAILYNYLYNAKGNSRFIPVLLDGAPEAAIPLPLDGHTRYRIRAFEFNDPDFQALYRELTDQPATPKPTLGDVIKLHASGTPISRYSRFNSAALIVMAPFIYTPAWAYRFILKSTFWFWWVLFLVGGAPRLDGGIEGLRADAYRKASAWIGIATGLFVVVGFGFGWLLKPWAEIFTPHAKLPTAVAFLVLVDWKSIPVVQWIMLASALTTIAVLIWTRDVYVDSQNPQRAARVAGQLLWLGELVKWKISFGAVSTALLMLYFALYANAIHHYVPVSEWAADWLRLLYGAAAERLRPVAA